MSYSCGGFNRSAFSAHSVGADWSFRRRQIWTQVDALLMPACPRMVLWRSQSVKGPGC